MAKYKVSDIAQMYREENPSFSHLDDTDIIQAISVDSPDVLRVVDRADLSQIMRESRKKKISQARQKQFGSLSGYSRFMSGVGQGMLDMYQGINGISQKTRYRCQPWGFNGESKTTKG